MKKLVPFLIIFIAVLILYHPVLTTYFSQDDFFHFKVSQTDGSLCEFFNLFGFHSFDERGIAFYRPLSRELIFNLYDWAAQRGKLAQKLVIGVQKTYPYLSKGAIIYFENDLSYSYLTKEWGGTSKQVFFILNGSDAIQLLYKDFIIKVFYQDLGGVPPNFPKDKIYSIVAKIN